MLDMDGIVRLYLVGFMGVGKTTVGRLLAKLLGWRFIDTDRVIERYFGLPVHEIFRQHGQAAFRRIETAVLACILLFRGVVVSTGGGAFVEKGNRSLISGLAIWLRVPFGVVLERLRHDTPRPLAGDLNDLGDLVELYKRFEKRRPVYELADLHVDADFPPERVVASIVKELMARNARVS